MTACSFGSNKWPHWAAPGQVVIRVSVGRDGDERWSPLPDEDMVGKLCEELGHVLGQRTPTPVSGGWRVSRWPAALPQYQVGHLERIAAVKATSLPRSSHRRLGRLQLWGRRRPGVHRLGPQIGYRDIGGSPGARRAGYLRGTGEDRCSGAAQVQHVVGDKHCGS